MRASGLGAMGVESHGCSPGVCVGHSPCVRCCARRSRARGECGTLSALPLSYRGVVPRVGFEPTTSRFEGEVTALCSVGSGWRMVRHKLFVRRRPWVRSGLVKKAAWQVVGSVGALAPVVVGERSNRTLQRRQLVQHGCSSDELARTEGFEPPPSGSVIRRIIQLCYVRVVRSCPQVAAGNLVETAGNAPAATILQGSSAPLCCPHVFREWCLGHVSSVLLPIFSRVQ